MDGPGVVCEQAGINDDGHHNTGTDCMVGGCHGTPLGTDAIPMKMGGTAFLTAQGAAQGTATIIVEWGTAPNVMTEKFITASAPNEGAGNFYAGSTKLAGITFPATVTVSLCPDPQKVMQTKINNAAELSCSKGGCHGNGTAKIYLK